MRENIQRKALNKTSSRVLQKSSSSFTMDDNIPIDFAIQVADVVAEKLKGHNLKDLHTLISRNQSKKFIKKIFRNNKQEYQKLIDTLNSTSDWQFAYAVTDYYFDRNNIDRYSKEALKLSNCIYLRYFPNENNGFKDK